MLKAESGRCGVADAEVAEVAPVDLGLLAGLDLDAQVGLARARGPHLGQVAPQRRRCRGRSRAP